MGTPVDKSLVTIPLGDDVHSADSPATFRIDYVNHEYPAAIRLRVKRSGGDELTYMITRTEDTVFLEYGEEKMGMFYHKIKPIREYIVELLALRSRITIEDPMGVQHKSFWELEL